MYVQDTQYVKIAYLQFKYLLSSDLFTTISEPSIFFLSISLMASSASGWHRNFTNLWVEDELCETNNNIVYKTFEMYCIKLQRNQTSLQNGATCVSNKQEENISKSYI